MNITTGGRPSDVYDRIYKSEPGVPFISRMLKEQSVIVDSELGIRACSLSTERPSRFQHIQTMDQLFRQGCETSRSLPCLGTRSTVEEPFYYYTYEEIDNLIDHFGAALRHTIGYTPGTENFVALYGRNSVEWVVSMHGCARQSYIFIPLYATLGAEALQYIISTTSPQLVVCHSTKEAESLLRHIAHSVKHVVIAMDGPDVPALKKELKENTNIYLFQEFIDIGKRHPASTQPPAPDQLFTICFTSGSTGIPKGVMINHEQMVNAVFGASLATEGKFVRQSIRHLSWLPLAHVLELLLLNIVLIYGACAAFLTGGPETFMTDLSAFKPTILTAVPRILARIYKLYMAAFPNFSFMRGLLDRCIQQKLDQQNSGDYNGGGILDYFFLKRLRDSFGGNICHVVVGGAPVVPNIANFFKAALNAPVTVGYGSTENCGLLTETLVGESDYTVVGAVSPWVEIRLIDIPDMDLYVARDGIGEICARGIRCTKGYYKDEENTEKLFTDDGWLKTGDVGTWRESGALAIVDRCKNMFKLAQGEYVASEKVEAVYQSFSAVLFAFVTGKMTENHAVVIVFPDFDNLRSLYCAHSTSNSDKKMAELTSNSKLAQSLEVRKFLLSKLNQVGRERGLNGFELAKNIHISPTEFTVESGLLTSTFKLVRHKATRFFAQEIESLYEEGDILSS